MITPLDLLPSAFGLEWGLSPAECLEHLPVTPERVSSGDIVMHLPFAQRVREVRLFFEDANDPEMCYWYDMYGRIYHHAQGMLIADYDTATKHYTVVGTID